MTVRTLSLPPWAKSLSARLLILTVFFVMLAEVLIYAPSIGRYRLSYLQERLAAGHLAILALEATPDNMVSEDLERELLNHVGAYTVGLKKPEGQKLILMIETPGPVQANYHLNKGTFFGMIGDAFMAMAAGDGRVLRVMGTSPKDPSLLVEVVLDEAPLRWAMFGYSQRILALSLVISLFTAALVYLSLHWLTVRPMRNMTESMIAFRDDPEDVHNLIRPSERSDEVGLAERELARMQEGLRAALQQKTRLAALGTAVTKINHDLRNILATASLVSDRLTGSEDPEVRRVTPTLIAAIDRAVKLCAQTLNFTREGPIQLQLSSFGLEDLMADVAAGLPETVNGAPVLQCRLAEAIELEGDRDQLYRVFNNLGQNALQAGASTVEITAVRENGRLVLEVADNGPGLSPRARENIFQPFKGSTTAGGTGLGLAIARELLRAHGGEIRLKETTAEGTCFRLELPLSQGAASREKKVA